MSLTRSKQSSLQFVSRYASFTAAVAAIGSTPTTLILDVPTTMTATTAVPATLSIEVLASGTITRTTGTLTIVGSFYAGVRQVFINFGTDYVKFSPGFGREVFPEWWGTTGDMAVYINAAIKSIAVYTAIGNSPSKRALGGGTVKLGPGSYTTNTPITMYQSIRLIGAGKESTRIVAASMTNSNVIILSYILVSGVGQLKANISIRDLTIEGGSYTNNGVFSPEGYGLMLSSIKDVNIRYCGVGIRIEGGWLNKFVDIDTADCIVGFVGICLNSSRAFVRNMFDNFTIQRFTRTGMFISGEHNVLLGVVCEFSSWIGTDAAPANVNSHAFPVGIEIFGKDATTLLLVGVRSYANIIQDSYFESITGGVGGVGIYIDNVDMGVDGLSLNKRTKLLDNHFINNVDNPMYINNAHSTFIKEATFIADVHVTLGAGAVSTVIESENTINIVDNTAAGGDYILHSSSMNDFSTPKIAPGRTSKFFQFAKNMVDDGTITLPRVTKGGYGVIVGNNGATLSHFVSSDAGAVTLINNTADVVANADTDTKLCIGTASPQEPIIIKNRLGAEKSVIILFWYD